jgi:hypothetical protein
VWRRLRSAVLNLRFHSTLVGKLVLFAAVQGQLESNRRHARQSLRGARYLLQGLVTCGQCGYAYYGKPLSRCSRRRRPRDYAYYRCLGTEAYRFGGERVCDNAQVRTDRLEAATRHEVSELLREPRYAFNPAGESSTKFGRQQGRSMSMIEQAHRREEREYDREEREYDRYRLDD